ncbi:50S ribosomal protein L19 [Tautonia sociabilis]|uniref:Large ribosomal subunit protein bL19 n=1 Tax=Tautonia sociabilis TaxID=2080755 RepID=A0A432MDL0_9BACT|nr:50S ribosomal protein L19 [Tautonia sociabilis]
MQNALMELVEKTSMRESVPHFEIGDTVDVHVRILEGDKERIQIFNGVVIARSGAGVREVFTVRRIVAGEGVERTFPVHSPRIADIAVKRSGKVRRAKLYYLRDRVGKAVRLKERVRGKATEAEAAAVRTQKREARKAKKAAKIEARAQRAAEGPKPRAKKGASENGESSPEGGES